MLERAHPRRARLTPRTPSLGRIAVISRLANLHAMEVSGGSALRYRHLLIGMLPGASRNVLGLIAITVLGSFGCGGSVTTEETPKAQPPPPVGAPSSANDAGGDADSLGAA